MSLLKKLKEVARVDFTYSALLITLGICIGYQIMPYFFRKPEKVIFEEGVLYGVLYYKEHLHRNGTFNYVSDSCVSIRSSSRDSFMIYK